MAKKLSRSQRQKQKQKQQNKLATQGYSRKEIERLSNADLEKVYKANITQKQAENVDQALKIINRKERERQRGKERRQALANQRQQKLDLLAEIVGTDPLNFGKYPTARFLDKLKLSDLRSGKYTREDFKEYIPPEKRSFIDTFDFDKVYHVPGGLKLHISYRSLNGETSIEDELAWFSQLSNQELIERLRAIKDMPQTRSRQVKGSKGRNVGSSGQAGEAMVYMSSQPALQELYDDQKNANSRANTRNKLLAKNAEKRGVGYQHSGVDYHWQSIRQKDESGRLKAYTEITPRKLLIIGNAIVWNITESDRLGFYNNFYALCCEIIPDMRKILP